MFSGSSFTELNINFILTWTSALCITEWIWEQEKYRCADDLWAFEFLCFIHVSKCMKERMWIKTIISVLHPDPNIYIMCKVLTYERWRQHFESHGCPLICNHLLNNVLASESKTKSRKSREMESLSWKGVLVSRKHILLLRDGDFNLLF